MSSNAGTGLHFWISVFLTLVLGFSPALRPIKDFKLQLRGSNISKATVNLKPVWSLLGLHMILVWVEVTNERESDYRSGEMARKVQWISAVTLLPCLHCAHQAQELQPWWALSFNQLSCSRRVFLWEFPEGNSPSSPTLTFSGSHAINFHKPYKKSQPKEQLVMLEEEVMKAYFL